MPLAVATIALPALVLIAAALSIRSERVAARKRRDEIKGRSLLAPPLTYRTTDAPPAL